MKGKKILLFLLFCLVSNSGWTATMGWAKVYEPLLYVQTLSLHKTSLDVAISEVQSLEVIQLNWIEGDIKSQHLYFLEVIGKPYLLESLKKKREAEEVLSPLNIVVDDVIVMVQDRPYPGGFKGNPLMMHRTPG